VIDGDTIAIGNASIRLAGIDAPELDQRWGQKAKWELLALTKGQVIRAELDGSISYDRTVARCYLPDGRDLAKEMVKMGLALDWGKFSDGEYRTFEPDGIRKKLWRVAAKHRGRFLPPS
jgi:micrococcal nuclease